MKKILKSLIIVAFAIVCFLGFNQKVSALESKTYEGIEFLPWEDNATLPTEGNYYLAVDVNLPTPTGSYVQRSIGTGKTLNLDLNGHTITHFGDNKMAYYAVYYVSGGTLSIYDSVGTGLITNCGLCCIWVASGTFNLYGGKISGNDYKSTFLNEYGGVCVDGNSTALFNMYGGEVTGNGNGNRDIHAYGAINFYGGHVGKVMIFTQYTSNQIKICGGSSTALIIDSITVGKKLQMTNGKIAAGSKINFAVYGYEKDYVDEAVVTNGFTTAGYAESDLSMFGCVKASAESTLLACSLVDNEIKLVEYVSEHTVEHHDGKAATCEEDGMQEYYQCTDCSKYFLDVDASQEVSFDDLIITKLGHDLTHYDAVPATCSHEGNVEYWTCSRENDVYYGDEAATVTLDSIVIPALNHVEGEPEYVWNEDYTECVATIKCTECHEIIHTESGTVIRDDNENKIIASFEYATLETQKVDLGNPGKDPTEKVKCGMHWVLIVLTILYIAFYACWYTILKEKEFKFLPAKIAKKLLPLFVSGLMFLFVMIFGIIGMSKGCGTCIAFFIIDVVLIAIAVVLYFFEEIVFAFLSKLFKKEDKEEQKQEQVEENK